MEGTEVCTNHCFPRNWLYERVEYLSKRFRTKRGFCYRCRIAIHAKLPRLTCCRHCWYALMRRTMIRRILGSALGNFMKHFQLSFIRRLGHISSYRSYESVYQPADRAEQEIIEQYLRVMRKDIRQVWSIFQIGEEGSDEAFLLRI